MSTALKLKLSTEAERVPQAWFLPGKTPDEWLSEVCTWSSSTDGYRFAVLAQLGATHEPAGVFVILPKAIKRKPGSRGQPYAEISPGFYVPVNACLWPPIEGSELKSLSGFSISIFHPSLGFFGAGDDEVLSTIDLLKGPPLQNGNWNIAQSPQVGNQRLRSVRLEAPLLLAEIFGDESREIGSEPISDLAPKPIEAAQKIPGQLIQRVLAVVVGGLVRLTALVPRSKYATPNWINHLENWAQRKLAGVFAELEKSRNAEIDKLLELLERNPEEGLKHSISLANLAQRGRAQASAKLARRALDFDIRRLGGGGPSDNWNVPAEVRNNLARLYRENAEREAKLGRHRRAAYIYAELLGDLSSAADALKQGRFFREAALLYKERLFKPLVAAECLVEGGCLHEAIEIYESHKGWLEVASLYTKLGDDGASKVALRKACEVYIDKGDIISAARLLESKLFETEEALALLASAWPNGRQAMECLEEQFALLDRLRRFKDLYNVIDTLGKMSVPPGRIADLIQLVSRTSQSCLDSKVRKVSKELVMQKASIALSDKSSESAGKISVLRSLTRVSPTDRLLTRDVNRFRAMSGGDAVIKRLPVPSKVLKKLTVEKTRTHEFPRIGEWGMAAGTLNGMVAVSRQKNGKIFFTRGTWTGAQQSVDWRDLGEESGSSFYLHVTNDSVILGKPLAAAFKVHELPSADAFDGLKCSVGTPAWLPQDTVQLSKAKGVYWVIRLANARPVLCSFKYGTQLYSRDITEELAVAQNDGESAGIFVDALGSDNAVAVGFCKSLLIKTNRDALVLRKFERQITGLFPSHASVPGWIVLHAQGASFVTAHGFKISSLSDDIPFPRATRLGDGRIVLLSGESGSVFQRVDTSLLPSGIFTLPPSTATMIGVMSTSVADEFAIAYSTGVLQRWKVGL